MKVKFLAQDFDGIVNHHGPLLESRTHIGEFI